jgi:hypothetical protein
VSNFLRKFRIISLSFLLVFILVGCGTDPVDDDSDPDPIVDTTAPVFSGVENVHFVIGDDAPDYLDGITVDDDTDGDLTTSIVMDNSLVDLAVAGTYTITITVSDEAGNEETDTFDVIVTEYVLTDQEKAELDISLIDLTDLRGYGPNGSSLSWSSSDKYVITEKGLVIRPSIGSDPVTVTLSATVLNGEYTTEISYDILVLPREESVVTSQTVLAFEGTSEEYIVEDQAEVDIYFVDEGTVPYIDVETYIDLINGAIESDELVYTNPETDVLLLTYEVEYEDFDGQMVTETFTATIDFTENTFTVNNFGFFENYVSPTESDYGEGLTYVGADYVDPMEVTIPLGEYKFDLVIHDDEGVITYLMPFHVANLLFAGGIYYDVYYNGDMLYGIDTFGISSSGEDDLILQDLVRTSSLNEETASEDLKEATYNFLALAFDFFYGLKEDQGVDTYYDYLIDYADDLISRTDTTMYRTIAEIAYGLDDLHTSHVFYGYYTDVENDYALTSIGQLGPNSQGYYTRSWSVQDLYEERFGAIVPMVRELDGGKTIVIYISGFSIDTPGEIFKYLDDLDPIVENVVLDLGNNGGGNLGAVLRIFGYMTEEQIQYHSQNPGDGSAVTYYIESDYVAYDYNWFIISSSVTFSAANLMVSIAKELGIATIIGKDSSGGASSIGVIMTPDGSTLLISTNNVLSTRVGDDYFSIEYGIEVDYTMVDITDPDEIIAAINLANSEAE